MKNRKGAGNEPDTAPLSAMRYKNEKLLREAEFMDYTTRFDGKGDIYDRARPRYAAELFEYMKHTLHIPAGSVFADIGSGTGIFTGQLLACGYRAFAVEPNGDMRRKAEEKLSYDKNFVSVAGSDAKIPLPDHSVDYITAAQAFHWFDADAFRKECERVRRPGGKILLVYNSRDEKADCTKALAALRRKYNPGFHGFSNGIGDDKCRAFFGGKCDLFRVDHTQVYNRQGYIDRVLSSSYSLKESDERYGAYLEEIHALFDRFSVDGLIAVPTWTVAYIG